LDENLRSLDDFNQQLITGFQLFKFVGEFRTRMIDCCKSIVDEINLPQGERTHSGREITQTGDGIIDIQKEKTFMISNCIVRVSWPDKKTVEFPDSGEAEVYTTKSSRSYGHGNNKPLL
jgi:hypothetical protein